MSLLLLLASSAAAQFAPITTPAKGTALRLAILDAIRGPAQQALGQQLLFRVDQLRSDGDWAFMTGVPLNRDGTRIDYRQTPFAEELQEGLFDDWLCALVKRQGSEWQLLALSIGATDVPYLDWPQRFGVSEGIVFALPE